MKKNFVIPILIVFAVVLFLGCTQPPVIPPVTPGTGVANSGTFLLAVKDKAPDAALLGSVKLTISSVSIHSQSGDSWIVLSNETKEFDLLELQDVQALLADKDLNAGNYNQIRFSIDKVLVDYNGTTQEAKLPSSVLRLNVQIEIDANKTSVAILDFDLNKSLHVTGNGKIIMLPVIKIVSEKDVNAEVQGQNIVKISRHGTVTDDSEIGTDLEGNNGPDKQVGQEKELEIDSAGKIKEKQNSGNNNNSGNGNYSNGNIPAEGRLVATIKDKALKEGRLDIANLRELNITIDSITIHRPDSSDANTDSWTELLSGEKTINLLAFQDSEALLADMNLAVGNFTQLRLGIKEAVAVIDSNTEDQNTETYDVKIPSGKLRLTSKIIVDANKTSYFNLDFDLNKSLHVTGNNQIIMKPVIKLVSKRNVEVQEHDSNSVSVEGGIKEQESETEFDENGNSSS